MADDINADHLAYAQPRDVLNLAGDTKLAALENSGVKLDDATGARVTDWAERPADVGKPLVNDPHTKKARFNFPQAHIDLLREWGAAAEDEDSLCGRVWDQLECVTLERSHHSYHAKYRSAKLSKEPWILGTDAPFPNLDHAESDEDRAQVSSQDVPEAPKAKTTNTARPLDSKKFPSHRVTRTPQQQTRPPLTIDRGRMVEIEIPDSSSDVDMRDDQPARQISDAADRSISQQPIKRRTYSNLRTSADRNLAGNLGMADKDEVRTFLCLNWIVDIYREFIDVVLKPRDELEKAARLAGKTIERANKNRTVLANKFAQGKHAVTSSRSQYLGETVNKEAWTQDDHDLRLIAQITQQSRLPGRCWAHEDVDVVCGRAVVLMRWLRHIYAPCDERGYGGDMKRKSKSDWRAHLQRQMDRREIDSFTAHAVPAGTAGCSGPVLLPGESLPRHRTSGQGSSSRRKLSHLSASEEGMDLTTSSSFNGHNRAIGIGTPREVSVRDGQVQLPRASAWTNVGSASVGHRTGNDSSISRTHGVQGSPTAQSTQTVQNTQAVTNNILASHADQNQLIMDAVAATELQWRLDDSHRAADEHDNDDGDDDDIGDSRDNVDGEDDDEDMVADMELAIQQSRETAAAEALHAQFLNDRLRALQNASDRQHKDRNFPPSLIRPGISVPELDTGFLIENVSKHAPPVSKNPPPLYTEDTLRFSDFIELTSQDTHMRDSEPLWGGKGDDSGLDFRKPSAVSSPEVFATAPSSPSLPSACLSTPADLYPTTPEPVQPMAVGYTLTPPSRQAYDAVNPRKLCSERTNVFDLPSTPPGSKPMPPPKTIKANKTRNTQKQTNTAGKPSTAGRVSASPIAAYNPRSALPVVLIPIKPTSASRGLGKNSAATSGPRLATGKHPSPPQQPEATSTTAPRRRPVPVVEIPPYHKVTDPAGRKKPARASIPDPAPLRDPSKRQTVLNKVVGFTGAGLSDPTPPPQKLSAVAQGGRPAAAQRAESSTRGLRQVPPAEDPSTMPDFDTLQEGDNAWQHLQMLAEEDPAGSQLFQTAPRLQTDRVTDVDCLDKVTICSDPHPTHPDVCDEDQLIFQQSSAQPGKLVVPSYTVRQSKKVQQQKGAYWLSYDALWDYRMRRNNIMGIWGVTKDHDGACIILSDEMADIDPMKSIEVVDTLPWPRSEDMNIRLTYCSGDMSMAWARAACWFERTTRRGIDLDQFCGDRGGIFEEMHGSHLCHHGLCINPHHVVYEEKFKNFSRNSCKFAAIVLRAYGMKVPRHCENENHEPRCLLQNAVLTTVEAIHITYSIVRIAAGLPPMDEPIRPGDHPRKFETFEYQLPLRMRLQDGASTVNVNRAHLTRPGMEGRKWNAREHAYRCEWCRSNHKSWTKITHFWSHLKGDHPELTQEDILDSVRQSSKGFIDRARRKRFNYVDTNPKTADWTQQAAKENFDWDVFQSWQLETDSKYRNVRFDDAATR